MAHPDPLSTVHQPTDAPGPTHPAAPTAHPLESAGGSSVESRPLDAMHGRGRQGGGGGTIAVPACARGE